MKRALTLFLIIGLLLSMNAITVSASDDVSIEIPTGDEWENIPELHQWPVTGDAAPLWDYTMSVVLSLGFDGNKADVILDVNGYTSATRIEAVIVFEKYINGSYTEVARTSTATNEDYLYYIYHPSASFGGAYRATAIVKVYSGSKYEYITLRNTRVYDSSYLD